MDGISCGSRIEPLLILSLRTTPPSKHFPNQEKIRQHPGGKEPVGILHQPKVANLRQPGYRLDHPVRMLHTSPDSGLGPVLRRGWPSTRPFHLQRRFVESRARGHFGPDPPAWSHRRPVAVHARLPAMQRWALRIP